MKILTKAFGEVEIEEKDIYNFPKGILGFEEYKKYALVKNKQGKVFDWLQSLEDVNLAFVIIKPEIFKMDYKVEISVEDQKILQIDKEEDIEIYSIVVIPSDPKMMTANLKAPILLNTKNNIGIQAINLIEEYLVRHYILDEMSKMKKKQQKESSLEQEGDD